MELVIHWELWNTLLLYLLLHNVSPNTNRIHFYACLIWIYYYLYLLLYYSKYIEIAKSFAVIYCYN